jgi:hypothetical protein
LGFVTDAYHGRAGQLDGVGVGGLEEEGRRRGPRPEALLAHAAQQVPHGHGHITKIDIDRAGLGALVAHRAVIRHVAELVPMLN